MVILIKYAINVRMASKPLINQVFSLHKQINVKHLGCKYFRIKEKNTK